ncbi:hypothetical protein Tco_1322046 [Tanacetum coccineum]
MANLEFCDKHNMVAYLEKSEGSEGFHEIIDFLSASHIHYALTESPTIYTSLIEQFWQTAALCTIDDGVMGITTTINRKVKITVLEASIRRHLKLEDSEGIPSLPTAEIFKQLALIGYVTTSDSLTFQKGHFSQQWKFFIHTILHCLSPKKTAWEQFSSNIATAIICLATHRTFNFSKFIFDAMTSPSKITSSPSLSSRHTSISAPSTSQPPITPTEEASPMPHESPLHSVQSLGRDEGNKKVYSSAITKLILRVKKLEKTIKTTKAKRKVRVVLSEDEDAAEDSSKQGRKIFDIDTDPTISLVQPQQDMEDMEYDFDATASIPVTTDGLEISIANIAVSTADAAVTTASASISIVSPSRVSTAEDISGAETLVYIRRSASKAKDKGKVIMQESEPSKKIKKRVQVQLSVDEELAKKVFEEEQAKFKAEQELEKSDFETTLELQMQLDEREEIIAKEAHDIDWVLKKVVKRKEVGRKHLLGKEQVKSKVMKVLDDAEKEDLKEYLNIVPEEGMNIEALQSKYPLIDWEIYIEDSRVDDLVKLWELVKERFSSTKPTNDKEKALWVELKRLFEPDTDDLLELQKYIHDPLTWRLYDACGVHHVSTKKGLDMFMLVEKDYPLTRGLTMFMLVNKLQVDQHSEMADELLRKIFEIANRPRQ